MSDSSRIDWLTGPDGTSGATINPWGWGCWGPGGSAESPRRCSYCFAERMAQRKTNKCPQCQAFIPHWHPEQLEKPLHWRKPKRVFVQSMGDPFGDWVTAEQLDRVLEVIAACPQHMFYMLTKAPQNIMQKLYEVTEAWPCRELGGGDYLPNLWLGASITDERSNEATADEMACLHAWSRFLSIEPLLGAISPEYLSWADWVIVGAQSGRDAAKHQPKREWVEDIVHQCGVNSIPVFVKSSLSYVSNRQQWPK